MIRNSIIKIVSLLLIVGLNWAGLSAVIDTFAYFNDTETSSENTFTAGTLDFSINSTNDFIPETIIPLQQSTRTVTVTNNGSLGFQYKITAGDFNGELCGALRVTADIDGGALEYEGLLTNLDTGAIVFSEPDEWTLTLSLPTNNSADVLENEGCQFKFVFDGWQESLSIGQGFNDSEEVLNSVAAGEWMTNPVTPLDGTVINGTYVKQCWALVEGAIGYIYQSCNNDPDNDGYCNERWYAEYPGTQTCKDASNVENAVYWWRVKVVFDSYITSYSQASKITIDNSHLNQVVINEFLPNPNGADNAPMPAGEWVELYNNKGEDIDVAGWWLYDENATHTLEITTSNTNTGGTLIRSGGFLVVYRNADPDFALNNMGGDTVRLYNGEIGSGGTLIDSYTYTINALEGKSFARIPDGSNNWVDPIPTPGEPNTLEGENIVFGPALSEPGEEDSIIEELITEEEPTEEELATEENQEQGGIIEEINEIIDEVIDEIVDEIMPDEETGDEVVSEPEVPVIEDVPIIEEAPADETPAVEEQPVIAPPENNSVEQVPPADNSGGGGDGGSGDAALSE